MKNLFNCAVLCIVLLSCKKDMDSPQNPLDQPKAKSFEVTFNVSEFGQQVGRVSKGNNISEAPLSEFADQFVYIAYNAEGKEVSRIRQFQSPGDSISNTVRYFNPEFYPDRFPEGISQPTFGSIKDSLPAGQYTIVMIASTQELSINNRSEDVLEFDFNPITQASFYYDRGLISLSRAGDTFFKKFTLTVANQDSQQNVKLDRIVGKAEINILDSKPGTTYKFLFDEDKESFRFSDEKPVGSTSDVSDEHRVEAVPGQANLSYSKFLLNTETPIDVIIKVFENGELSATKTVEAVRFFRNKRTILTGNIYTQKANTSSFTITVNDEFDADSVVVSF